MLLKLVIQAQTVELIKAVMPVKAAKPVILDSAARCTTAVQSDEYVNFARSI